MESAYISELNKSTGELGFISFTSESRAFIDELDELSFESGINIEDLPKEYLNFIDSLKQVLNSVNNSARLRQLAELESYDEDRDDLRSNFDKIAKNNGLDLSGTPSIPPLSLIQKIKDFEKARLLAEKEAERKANAERIRQEQLKRMAKTEEDARRAKERDAYRDRKS